MSVGKNFSHFILVSCLAATACADRQINTTNVDVTIAEFQAGKIALDTSVLAGGNGIFYLQKYIQMANASDWPQLSKLVIQVNSGDNLGWFFLGLSAEKLGYIQAAKAYYQNSIDAKLQYSVAGPIYSNSCGGLHLPDEAENKLNLLEVNQ